MATLGLSVRVWAASPALQITEFMAVNDKTVEDADGDASPWIEIRNPTSANVNLNGWFLTDDTNNLALWRFPEVTLLSAANANESDDYMVVFASEKNRTNNTAELHTNFRLPTGNGYLALVDPNTNIVSVFENYPEQQKDVSYGRDPIDATTIGYMADPTPGKPNSMTGSTAGPAVGFSQTGSTFVAPFTLELSVPFDAVIYYTTNGTAPTESSFVYDSPITIDHSVQIRARAFAPGLMPGAIHSESFLQLDSSLVLTNSDLPAIIIYNFNAGAIQQPTNQMANISIYEPQSGVTSLTNAPTLTMRAGIHLHGSSTLTSPKQSYAVEFWDDLNNDLDCAPLGLPEESDFILYGPDFYEPVLMHNPLMYQLSNDVGRYAPRTRFVEVYLNVGGGPVTAANYNGIYVLEEKIKWGPNRVNIPKVHSVDALHPADNSAPNVTGGYIAKADRLNANESGFVADGVVMAYDYPNEQDIKTPQRGPQRQYFTNYLNSFSAAVNGTNFTDPVLGYRPFIDVPSWIDYHILNVLAFNVDTLNASTYFYKGRNDKLYYGPIWDFDRTQGSKNTWDFNPRVWGQAPTDMFRKYWWWRVFSDVDFWQEWIDRYEDLRETAFSTNHIFATIDMFAGQVSNQAPREAKRWPTLTLPRIGLQSAFGYSYTFSGTYGGEVTFLKQWYSDRLQFLDTNFMAKPVFNNRSGAIFPGSTLGMSSPMEAVIYYTTDGSDPRLPGGAISPAALVYNSAISLTTNVTFRARAYNPFHSNMTGTNNPVVSSHWSGLTSESFMTVTAPTILNAPADLQAYIGQTGTFSVTATGTPAPSYQWTYEGNPLEGETNAQLTVALTDPAQSGHYAIVVTNIAGVTSASFVLTVTPKPHLVVTEVESSEAKAQKIASSDWWELSNLGDFPVNLQGYRFNDDHDSLDDAFTITNAIILAPGESVILVEDLTAANFRTWWGPENLPANLQIITYPSIGFSSDGDEIHLWNAAATTDEDTVTDESFSVATKGVSFGYDVMSQSFGALSVAGENGAFVADLNGDVGSPGRIMKAFELTTAIRTETNFSFGFLTLPELTYYIAYKNTLSDTNWTPWTNFLAPSNTFQLFDDAAETNSSRFYRVIATP